MYKTSSYCYTKHHFSLLGIFSCILNFFHFKLKQWFYRTYLWRVCDHTVRAALLNDCKSPFGVEGASKVFSLGVISKPWNQTYIFLDSPRGLRGFSSDCFVFVLFCFFKVLWEPRTSVAGLEELRIFRPGPSRPLVHSSR